MQIISFIIIYYVVMKMLHDYEPFHKKVERMDNDPMCNIKSDKWHREHRNLDKKG